MKVRILKGVGLRAYGWTALKTDWRLHQLGEKDFALIAERRGRTVVKGRLSKPNALKLLKRIKSR